MSHVIADAASFWHRHSSALPQQATQQAQHRRIAAKPPLAHGERVLRRCRGGGQLVVTDRALYERTGDDGWRRIPWADIAIAGWSRAESVLVLRLWTACADGPHIRITGDASVAALVEDRVAAARVLVRRVELRPGVGGTVVAVRDADHDVVQWRLLVAGQELRADDELRTTAERVIAEIRRIAGC